MLHPLLRSPFEVTKRDSLPVIFWLSTKTRFYLAGFLMVRKGYEALNTKKNLACLIEDLSPDSFLEVSKSSPCRFLPQNFTTRTFQGSSCKTCSKPWSGKVGANHLTISVIFRFDSRIWEGGTRAPAIMSTKEVTLFWRIRTFLPIKSLRMVSSTTAGDTLTIC